MVKRAAIFGGIEGGGTKFLCVVGNGPKDLRAETRIPTTSPQETLGRVIEFFKAQQAEHGKLHALGIGTFGPIELNKNSPKYGRVLGTPKPGWSGTDLIGTLRGAFKIPIGFEIDVNAAAIGERQWGAARGLTSFIYVTIGTGIGGGGFVEGKLLHGLQHAEMGHISLPHDRALDPFEGSCPYHKDCFEGLACGPAIERRWGQRAENLPEDHPAWELEADYIAHALATYSYVLSPQKIIVGGGVGSRPHLLERVRQRTGVLINSYLSATIILNDIDSYMVPPGLGGRSGVLGALALAKITAK